jgi:hypothetical protein
MRFMAIMAFLCDSLFSDGIPKYEPIQKLVFLLRHLDKYAQRFARLLVPLRIKQLRGPRATPTKPRAPKTPAPDKPPAEFGVPTRFAWLRTMVRGDNNDIGIARRAFEELMYDPEMAYLISTDPAFGRILRPLCYALGIERPPSLYLPPRDPALPKPFRKPRRKQFRYARDSGDGRPSPPLPFAPGHNYWPAWIKPPKIPF